MTRAATSLKATGAAVLFLGLAATPATGQFAAPPADVRAVMQPRAAQPAQLNLAQWTHQQLRGALSAEQLMAATVRGRDGERLGRIDEIFVGPHGAVTSVGVAVGGILGLAQRHLRVAWGELALGGEMQDVRVPLARDDVPRFALFDRAERMPGEHRATELLRTHVVLADGTRYGPLDDLIIGRDGRVQALVVRAGGAFARGQYALPFNPRALHAAGQDVIVAPVHSAQLAELPPFNYQALAIGPYVTGRFGTGIGGLRDPGVTPGRGVGAAGGAQDAGSLVPGGAALAHEAAPSRGAAPQATGLGAWDVRQLHGALSVERLRGLEVRGRGHQTLGTVHDLVMDAAGRVTAFGIAVGGVAGVARNVLRVPAAEVAFAPGLQYVLVPLSRAEAGGFALFDRVDVRPGEWRASELLRGQVTTADGARYGPVVDLIVDRRGALRAVVADARVFVGMRAVPFDPAGLALREREYRVGFVRSELDNERPFDYVGLAIGPAAGADARVGIGVGGTTDGAATGRLGPAGAQRTH
jgi:sporulation protein YlmC with PRC-barrel domain